MKISHLLYRNVSMVLAVGRLHHISQSGTILHETCNRLYVRSMLSL